MARGKSFDRTLNQFTRTVSTAPTRTVSRALYDSVGGDPAELSKAEMSDADTFTGYAEASDGRPSGVISGRSSNSEPPTRSRPYPKLRAEERTDVAAPSWSLLLGVFSRLRLPA